VSAIVKIVDFGTTVKYSNPIIGSRRTLLLGQASSASEPHWTPNWYTENSDAIYATDHFCNYAYPNDFVRNIFGWMLGSDKKTFDISWLDHETKNNFTAGGERPNLKILGGKYSRGTPANVLQNSELMGDYLKAPKSGHIVTLGVIS